MAHHADCTAWTYATHPDLLELERRCDRLTRVIARRVGSFARFHFNTRPGHRFMFKPMVPSTCPCLVGNYRGDALACRELAVCNVRVPHDPRIGLPYYLVAGAMVTFEQRCKALTDIHAKWLREKGATQPARNALLRYVAVLADLLETFLTIHPYCDGNGHAARLLIWVLMARAGYLPRSWSIHAKQPYADALSAHRDGKRGALQEFLLRAIQEPPQGGGLPGELPADSASGQSRD